MSYIAFCVYSMAAVQVFFSLYKIWLRAMLFLVLLQFILSLFRHSCSLVHGFSGALWLCDVFLPLVHISRVFCCECSVFYAQHTWMQYSSTKRLEYHEVIPFIFAHSTSRLLFSDSICHRNLPACLLNPCHFTFHWMRRHSEYACYRHGIN